MAETLDPEGAVTATTEPEAFDVDDQQQGMFDPAGEPEAE
jgi:hypothetical protein